jgi:hypothetical protein
MIGAVTVDAPAPAQMAATASPLDTTTPAVKGIRS